MKDVKAVLVACAWDDEAAFMELRKRGLAAAGKKRGRTAAEGLLGVASAPGGAAVVEVNSETDFVARTDLFRHLVSRVAAAAWEAGLSGVSSSSSIGGIREVALPHLEACVITLEHPKLQGEATVRDMVAEVAAITGEHVRLRRGFRLSPPESSGSGCGSGAVGTYLHASPEPGLARIAGLVSITGAGNGLAPPPLQALQELAAQLAMHVVAARPLFLCRELVTEDVQRREREILATQASTSGKPQKVVDKIVGGRLQKYFEDVVLLEQPLVMDDSKTVGAFLSAAGKDLDCELAVAGFLRVEVGEGIEREDKDFAAEVAAQVGRLTEAAL
eukprot:SM000287S10624  [mRNA]  locus=s287:35831:38144:+ [translate_table: standard]